MDREDSLVFQGSDDDFNSDIVDYFTVGYGMHNGWNYFDLDSS